MLSPVSTSRTLHPLSPSIKLQILLSYHHTFLTEMVGEAVKISRDFNVMIMFSILMTSLTDTAMRNLIQITVRVESFICSRVCHT